MPYIKLPFSPDLVKNAISLLPWRFRRDYRNHAVPHTKKLIETVLKDDVSITDTHRTPWVWTQRKSRYNEELKRPEWVITRKRESYQLNNLVKMAEDSKLYGINLSNDDVTVGSHRQFQRRASTSRGIEMIRVRFCKRV